jgi:hypothetical protein
VADRGRVQQQYPAPDEHPCRPEFEARAARSFAARGRKGKIKTWVSVQQMEPGDGFAEHYPHVHYPLTGLTLVHYLQTGDTPAPLQILDGDEVIEEIAPYVGLVVFMPNAQRHGVLRHHDPVDRIQLIATVN